MHKVGIEPAPPGRVPNFDSPSDLQVGILAVYVVTSFLATIGLALRFYTGAVIVRNLGLDACRLRPSDNKIASASGCAGREKQDWFTRPYSMSSCSRPQKEMVSRETYHSWHMHIRELTRHSIVLLFASWAVYLASFVGMLKVFPCGFGKHLWSVTEAQLKCYVDVRLSQTKTTCPTIFHRGPPSVQDRR